jgi:hypothetical protein
MYIFSVDNVNDEFSTTAPRLGAPFHRITSPGENSADFGSGPISVRQGYRGCNPLPQTKNRSISVGALFKGDFLSLVGRVSIPDMGPQHPIHGTAPCGPGAVRKPRLQRKTDTDADAEGYR